MSREERWTHLTYPAGPCPHCDPMIDTTPQAGDPALRSVTWKCPTHGTAVQVIGPRTCLSVTLRSAAQASAIVAAFIAKVAVAGPPPKSIHPAASDIFDMVAAADVDEATAAVYAHFVNAYTVRLHKHEAAEADPFIVADPLYPWAVLTTADPAEAIDWVGWEVLPAAYARFPGSQAQWDFLTVAALPAEAQWGALADVVSPQFAAFGHAQGRTPQEVAALGSALSRRFRDAKAYMDRWQVGHRLVWSVWSREHSALLVEIAGRATGVDWSDLAVCLDAGMGPEEAMVFIRQGRDMDPVRLVAGLRRDPESG